MYRAPPLIVGVKGHAYNFKRERESLGLRLQSVVGLSPTEAADTSERGLPRVSLNCVVLLCIL